MLSKSDLTKVEPLKSNHGLLDSDAYLFKNNDAPDNDIAVQVKEPDLTPKVAKIIKSLPPFIFDAETNKKF